MRKKYLSIFAVIFLFLAVFLIFTCSQQFKSFSPSEQLSIDKPDNSVSSLSTDEKSVEDKVVYSSNESVAHKRQHENENQVHTINADTKKPEDQKPATPETFQNPEHQLQAIMSNQQEPDTKELISDSVNRQESEPSETKIEYIPIKNDLQKNVDESELHEIGSKIRQGMREEKKSKELPKQSAGKALTKFSTEKLTYTIQLASYKNALDAEHQFNILKRKLNVQQKNMLRIEFIKGYFTLRLGKFDTAISAHEMIPKVKNNYPSAYVLKGYIKDERIHSIVGPTSSGGEVTQVSDELSEKRMLSVPLISTVTPTHESQEYFTIQIGSFRDEYDAIRSYESFVDSFDRDMLDSLRIEKVRGYHTLRLGRFEKRAAVQELVKGVQVKHPDAIVLSAYFKKNRISKIYQAGSNASVGKGPILAPELKDTFVSVTETMPEIVDEVEAAGETLNEDEDSRIVEEVIVLPEKIVEQIETPTVASDVQTEQEAGSVKQVEGELSIQVVAILTADEQGGRIAYPGSVFTDNRSGEIFVIVGGDRSRTAVVYGPDYLPLVSLGPGRGITSPVGGFINPQGKLYMCQVANPDQLARLSIYNAAFFLEKEIVLAQLMEKGSKKFSPKQIAASPDGNRIYIAGPPAPGVMVLDADGDFLHWLKPTKWMGSEKKVDKRRKGQDTIVDVFIDRAGDIYLLSEETGTVYIYNSSEEFQRTVGEKGGTYGKLSRPRGVAVDRSRGLIYVVDYLRHAILVYNLAGKMLSELAGRGVAPAWVNFPTDLAIDSEGNLVVADFFNGRVQVWEIVEKGKLIDDKK